MKLLLGSGGFSTAEKKKGWIDVLDQFLGDAKEVLFVPYALEKYDWYTQRMIELKFDGGRRTRGIHEFDDPIDAVEKAEVIYVGGGNSFRLLNTIYELQLIEPIRKRVQAGTRYVGTSAGSNFACPTIKTTNDMPIVHPPKLEALDLIPFQINPHYFYGPTYVKENDDYHPYGGETRDVRLQEFHEMNNAPVLGLCEGTTLWIEDNKLTLHGVGGARLFKKGEKPTDHKIGESLGSLI